MLRRTFLACAAGSAFVGSAAAGADVPLGIDLFSLRSQGWNAFELLDYCSRQNVKVVHFSEIRFLGSLERENLRRVRARADELGIRIETGMTSICPTSKRFDPAQGTAEEQIIRMLDVARTLGSPIVRCYLGTMEDRRGPLPIEGHIENTVRVLRNVRSPVIDSGIKIAVENHAGDMQARELKSLIEGAGKEFVGACLDSGNPLWALEDPHLTLETLAPYVLTSHVRDTAVWRVPEGVAVQWVRMGEGNVGIADYVRKYIEKCPGRPLSLEVIVTQPRIFPCFDANFREAYRKTPAWEFARFLALAERGKPHPAIPVAADPRAREREDLESSIAWTKKLLAAGPH